MDHAPAQSLGSLVYSLPSLVERLDLKALFPMEQPLELELGAGDGGFILAWAQANPERNFLGVERLLGRLRKIDKRGRRAGLKNLRVLRLEASYVVQWLVPHTSVHAVHIYFPDPWPKRKHQRRRLINEALAEHLSKALIPGGHVFIRTDDANYFEQIQAVFGATRNFTLSQTPAELSEVQTDFERDFQAKGIRVYRAAYRRT